MNGLERIGAGRVVIVAADEVERHGRVEVLRRWFDAELPVEGRAPSEVEAWSAARWAGVGLVVVGVDDPGAWDRYWPIRAGRAALAALGPAVRVVGLLQDGWNPVVWVRLRRAGIDEVVAAADARATQGLVDLVHGDAPTVRPEPDAVALGSLGIGPATDPDAAVDLVQARGLEAAFRSGINQRGTGLSRRAIQRLRRDVTAVGDLHPSWRRLTGGADRDTSLPTWREVVTYVNLSRGARDPEVDDDRLGFGAIRATAGGPGPFVAPDLRRRWSLA